MLSEIISDYLLSLIRNIENSPLSDYLDNPALDT